MIDLAQNEEYVQVFRGRQSELQSVWQLVVGDLIKLQVGDKVPADCILLSDQKIWVNERQCSVGDKLTHTPKDSNDPFLLANSYVSSGFCKALVVCVGSHSTRGIYETSFNQKKEKTELAQKLSNLSKSFTYLGCLFAVVILGAGIGIQII